MHAQVLLMIWTADEGCECGVAKMTSHKSCRFVVKIAYVSNTHLHTPNFLSPRDSEEIAIDTTQTAKNGFSHLKMASVALDASMARRESRGRLAYR